MTDVSDIPNVLTDELRETLAGLAVATLTHQLQNRGMRSTFLSGLKPLLPGQSMVGRARTLRYVAHRQDNLREFAGGLNAQRRASESAEPGDVLVIEARDVPDAGTVGDIYAMRAYGLGAVGIITDGALRDTAAIAELGKPVYHRASHGSTWGRHHMPFSNDEPITCAGVYVEPGDIIVGDQEGAVVIPHALVEEVARDAVKQELAEEFAIERVKAGESVVGLFPLTDDRRPEFEEWLAARGGLIMAERRSIEIEGLSHKASIPVATRIGPLLVSSVIVAFDLGTRNLPEATSAQVDNIYTHVERILDAGGGTWADVAKMDFWVPSNDVRAEIDAVWREKFPDESSRPSRHIHVTGKFVSATVMAYID